MSYFDRLQSDMQQLGVAHDDRPPETYKELVQLMDTASGKDNYDHDVVKNIDPSELSTAFARYALHLCLTDPFITDTPGEIRHGKQAGICDMAEYRIATGLLPENFTDASVASPIVVMEVNDAVGIVQRSRNARRMIYYALRDSVVLPSAEKCVYTLPLPYTAFTEPLKADHPWHMPSYYLVDLLDTGRLSAFTIPVLERHKLSVNNPIETSGLQRTHEALLGQASAAFAYAAPLGVKPEARKAALESLR